jgi:hypothetical protein
MSNENKINLKRTRKPMTPAERVRKLLKNNDANWLARDSNGRWYFYENKPYIVYERGGCWIDVNDFYEMSSPVLSPTLLKSLRKLKEIHWKDTLLSIDNIDKSTLFKES